VRVESEMMRSVLRRPAGPSSWTSRATDHAFIIVPGGAVQSAITVPSISLTRHVDTDDRKFDCSRHLHGKKWPSLVGLATIVSTKQSRLLAIS